MKKSFLIDVKGLVQGVGFRPLVNRIAQKNGLEGWVNNQNDSVQIKVSGNEDDIERFVRELYIEKPEIAEIESLKLQEVNRENQHGFHIVKSSDISKQITRVSPDLAVCDACLEDMKAQLHRINYPFINCTYCGPRFSIIKKLPYDRVNTTMQEFKMCPTCEKEYRDIHDRRFHAEPVACNHCGPHYQFEQGTTTIDDSELLLLKCAELIDQGGIVAIKGIGGYFIACDATNSEAVARLRIAKKRYGKPFALMMRDLSAVEKYAWMDEKESQLLLSIKRPIVLMKQKTLLPAGINNGLAYLGIMLPYMPFHYLLFEKLKTDTIVLTSGNLADEPIVIDDKKARKKLSYIVDAIVSHNRKIYNRVDDSVAYVANSKQRLMRRSRGYAPDPVYLPGNCEGIFAAGAELTNCFALGKGQQVILSQYIGDLKNFETFSFYKESYRRFCKLFRFQPTYAACDLHPDYLSTRFSEKIHIPLLRIQHHHAHIASVLAEHKIKGKVIGVCFDGTGYGTDGKIWGGEFLWADLEGFTRFYHFDSIPISGGDKAVEHPWRSAISYLHHYKLLSEATEWIEQLKEPQSELVVRALDNKINCPESSSAGRLFDAIAALTGICLNSSYQSEAPMKLESVIHYGETGSYAFNISGEVISFKDTFRDVLNDMYEKTPVSVIAARFHNTIVQVVFEICKKIRNDYRTNTVALSGGTFQNRYLFEHVTDLLKRDSFKVISNEKVPSNDGGIALGQMAIATKIREKLCV